MIRSPLRWLLCLVLGLALAMPSAVAMPVHGGADPCLAHLAGSGFLAQAEVGDGSELGPAERLQDHEVALTAASCQLCGHCAAAPLGPARVALPAPESPAAAVSPAWPPTPLERLDRPPRL